jgi:hypothetical protein
MKYTLLELNQAVLSSIDSDEINSIYDTPESKQVTAILKTVYDDIISRGDLTSNKILFNLVSSTTVTKPVLMTKPANIDRMEWLKYNTVLSGGTTPVWTEMVYLSVEDFIDYSHQYRLSETNVRSFDYVADGFVFTFHYRNDQGPKYYTSFDDVTIIFDAYNVGVDTNLQSTKTLAYGSKKTEWIEADTFVPNLQPQQFALLLNEAKSLAWAELKQTSHPKAEVSARRNWRHLQKTRNTTPMGRIDNHASMFDQLPNFGRR